MVFCFDSLTNEYTSSLPWLIYVCSTQLGDAKETDSALIPLTFAAQISSSHKCLPFAGPSAGLWEDRDANSPSLLRGDTV